MGGRPRHFGEISPVEKDIIEEIVFYRTTKKKTFKRIAEDLNAQGRWPRRALKWTIMLVYHVWKAAKERTEVTNVNT
ncbi:MAG: hypothetical protein NT140_08980 [Deltaproteobacteria bacterium]|nr:hypothetical protein [Deltaproteobacteria bacterium]